MKVFSGFHRIITRFLRKESGMAKTLEELPTFSLLPIEIRPQIYKSCLKRDLCNLTLCDKFLRNDVLPLLWDKMDISWRSLEKSIPQLLTRKKSNSSIEFISELKFSGGVEKSSNKGNIGFGFGFFLQLCDPHRLMSLEICHFIPDGAMRLLAEKLLNLESLRIEMPSISRNHITCDWPCLKSFTKLKTLALLYCTLKVEDLKIIFAMESLCSLQLTRNGGISDSHKISSKSFAKAMVPDFKLKNLLELNLNEIKTTDAVFTIVSANCNKLEVLKIGTGATDLGLSCISHISTLKLFSIRCNNSVTDSSIFFLTKLPHLTTLCVEYCSSLTPHCLPLVGRMESLCRLKVRFTNTMTVTDELFNGLGNLTNLRSLDMYDMNKLTNASLQVIAKMKCLEELNISNCCQFTDEGLIYLTHLPRLKALSCYLPFVDVYNDDDDNVDDDETMKITSEGLALYNLSPLLVDGI